MADGNPFGYPPQSAMGPNPYDPGYQQHMAAPPNPAYPHFSSNVSISSESPYAAPPPGNYAPAYGQPAFVQQTSPYAPPPTGYSEAPQAPLYPSSTSPYATAGYGMNPYESAPPPAPVTNETALVVSQYQSNPYGNYASPTSQAANPFDPFAPPPPPAPAPPPFYNAQPAVGMPPNSPSYAAGYQMPVDDPLGAFSDISVQSPPPQPAPAPPPQPAPAPAPPQPHPVSPTIRSRPSHSDDDSGSHPRRRREETAEHPAYRGVRNESANDHLPSGSPRNKYASEIARQAPPGASPLPKAELVRKRGYVLARISFRTIVIKKWKQTFWVQYGPHTMLWFRSEADFDDWLNNPYHSQAQRNFLIKLAVNFVHDLYKPNVRGYQVTQCRTKAYGNKMVRQFKLERWMDYGPTIAAAFGSYNPKEVDDLREALVECMRNTPLSGGIRATGAVRQKPQQHEEERRRHEPDRERISGERHSDPSMSSPQRSRPTEDAVEASRKDTEDDEPGQEADLLDVNNWDDVPSQAAAPPYHDPVGMAMTPYGAPPGYAGYPSPQQDQQQYLMGQQPQPYMTQPQPQYQPQQPMQYPAQQSYPPQQPYPPQQQPYSNAIVHVGSPQSYPGAIPMAPAPPAAPGYGYADPWAGQQQQQQQPPQQPQPYPMGY